MSVTVSQQPQDFMPVHNPQIFVGLSNQIAQANFVYTVVVTDLISSESQKFQVPKRPDDSRVVFDASSFAQSFFTNHDYIPKNVYGWQRANGIRKIRVNIGETYGTFPATYHAGSNIDYIVWNGVEDVENFADFDRDNRVFATTRTADAYLTGLIEDETYQDRSSYLYVLTSEANDVQSIHIFTYDSEDNVINQSEIPNPWEASTTYTDKYICIDVGHKGLSNIASGDVTGAWPIMTDDCAYYKVLGPRYTGSPPSWGTQELLKLIRVKCEARHEVFTVHFKAKNGCYETINFSKVSETDVTANREYYKQYPWEMDSGTYSYDPSEPQDKQISSARTKRFRLNTDWLSEDQIELYQEIIDSDKIYLDKGSSVKFKPLKVVTDSYRINKAWNEPLYQITMDFELAYTDHR